MLRTSGYAKGTANPMLVMFKTLFNLAKKWITPGAEINPIVGIDLVDPQNAKELFLTAQETQRLRLAIQDSDNSQLNHIVGLLLLCGCRKRQLLDARREDIDLTQKSWRIPMTKNGKPRHVPLSSAALSVLSQVPRWEGCPYVLPNPKTKLPFVSFFCSWNTARVGWGPGYRVYYAIESKRVVLLCEGGDKRTQAQDICRAIGRWNEWQQRSKHEN